MKPQKITDLLEKNPDANLKDIVLNPDYYITVQSSKNGKLLDYLFGKRDDEYGKLTEILDYILTKHDSFNEEKEKGTYFSDDRKIAHNLCILFANKEVKDKKMSKILNPESPFIDRLKTFLLSNPKDYDTNSRFSQLVRSVLTTNKDIIENNKWIVSALLAFPDRAGYSSLLFAILRDFPDYYRFVAQRSADFMRAAQKDNNLDYKKDSYILLNEFSLLIKSGEIKIEYLNAEIMKNILDATLIGQKIFKIAFYEGIFITSSIQQKVEDKSTISRYIKAVGKAFYTSLNLFSDKFEIEPDMDLNEELKVMIAAFPAFYRSGFKKLFKLMFRKTNVVSSDFGRICLDYITKMPEAKFRSFIDDNDIPRYIMEYLPKLPNDKELLENPTNIQYLNPHVILLAFYIIEGLPKKRATGQNTVIKNTFCAEKAKDEEFINFVVTNLLPFRQLALPDLQGLHPDHTRKLDPT